MLPLANLDLVILDELRHGRLDALALHQALDARSEERRARPRERRPWRPSLPEIAGCSFSAPSVDDHGMVAMSGALSRLSISDAISVDDEADGQQAFDLTNIGRDIVAHPEFADRVDDAERRTGQWQIDPVLACIVILGGVGAWTLLSRLF